MTKMSRVRASQRPLAEVCADCGAGETNWLSINRGVYLCNDCLSVHRQLGRHISIVKHLRKCHWHPNLLNMVQHLSSAGANSIWEHTLLDPGQIGRGKRKPNPSDHILPKKDEFIRTKYLQLNYVHRLNQGDSGDISMQLHSSVRTGNLETSLRLLSLGAEANFVHPEKRNTPLHVAAKAGQILQVELLVVYGADPYAVDPNRKTAEDLARAEGHIDLADRLMELKYELTDRLTYYVCQQRPDHKAGIHYKLTPTQTKNEGRKKLEGLDDQSFEELAMDIYDEVDRRELEGIWQDTQRNIIIPGNKTINTNSQDVPFLPLIPQYSQTRNQGRQKLALFKEDEFLNLISDLVLEALRRQNLIGTSVVEVIENDDPIYDLPPDGILDYKSIEQSVAVAPTPPATTVQVSGSVSIEKYQEVEQKLQLKEKECCTLLELNRELTSKATALAKERHELTKKLNALTAANFQPSATTTDISSIQAAIKIGPKSPTGRPTSVYNMNDTSSSQSSLASADGRRRTICGEGQFDAVRAPSHEELRQPINMPKNLIDDKEQTEGQTTSDKSEGGSPTQDDDGVHVNSNQNNNQSPTLGGGSPLLGDSESDSKRISPALDEKMWPEKYDLHLKTEQLTRNIQALHGSAQSKKIENYLQCAENVYSGVNDLIALFPKPNCAKSVKSVLQQLYGSAHKLRQCCKEIEHDEYDNNERVKQITEEIMSYAYEVAKAEKQLVTMAPHQQQQSDSTSTTTTT